MASVAAGSLAIAVGLVSPLAFAPPAVAAQSPRPPQDSAAVRDATARAWARLADGLRRGDQLSGYAGMSHAFAASFARHRRHRREARR